MHKGSYNTKQTLSEDLRAIQVVLEPAGITGNQLSLALDKAYKSYTGRSALEAAGIQLVAPTQNQLLNPYRHRQAVRAVSNASEPNPSWSRLPAQDSGQMGSVRARQALRSDAGRW